MKIKVDLCCSVVVLVCFNSIGSVPVLNKHKSDDFVDEWDFHLIQQNFPLLNNASKYHELPPPPDPSNFAVLADEPSSSNESIGKLQRLPKVLGDAVRSRVSCTICRLGVRLLLKEITGGTPFEGIKDKFVNLCSTFKVATESVCNGAFEVYGPEVVPAFNESHLEPLEICSMVLGETCGVVNIPQHDWEVQIPPKINVDTEAELPKAGLPTLKVLHISDTHYDPLYAEGSATNCAEPLCCRANSTVKSDVTPIPAGKWGSYKSCDSPKILLESMLEHISKKHPDIDFILWTGDMPPHDIWLQTKESNLKIIEDTTEMVLKYFPDIPIFPAIGNHESQPAGNFAPPWAERNHAIDWLYQQIANQWRRWLPASVGNTVRHGAFYSVLVRPGLRVISINTNYCHSLSWWLLVNSTDPAKELKWLTYELEQSERKGEKVYLIGHIPPGASDCMKVWSKNFYFIVNRFERTIVAQFYGHTHGDEFEVFYNNSRPTNVAYVGPSVTPYDDFNPAYRLYYFDGEHEKSTWEVLDHETWYLDLDEVNASNDPKWMRLYSAREAYNLESLRPKEWASLIQRMVGDPSLFETFHNLYYRNSSARPSCDDSKCKLQTLCDLKSGRSHSKHQLCHDLEVAFGT